MPVPVIRIDRNVGISPGTTVSVTIPPGLTVPASYRVLVGFCSNSDVTDGAVTAADTKGNTYAVDNEDPQPQRRTCAISSLLTTPLVAGDSITVTVPVSASRRAMDVLAVNLLQSPDVVVPNSGNSTSPSSGATPLRRYQRDFLFGVCGWNTTVTGDLFAPGGAFTDAVTVEAFSASLSRNVATAYQVVTAVGTDAATGTLSPSSRAWSMLAVAYPTGQVLGPSADISGGGWTNEAGAATSLFASVDEDDPANDADYIQSSDKPTNDAVELKMPTISAPPAGPGTLYIRHRRA